MISSMINHEQAVRDNLQMLKLHLGWPDRDKHMGRPDEGLCFYDWLQRERAQAAVVQKIRRVEDVVAFIVANRVVLGRSVEVRNARRESRHETNLQVLVNVSEASDADFVGLSLCSFAQHRGKEPTLQVWRRHREPFRGAVFP